MLEGGAGFEMDTFWGPIWKNPLLDSDYAVHSGPNGACSGDAKWTVTMPNNQGN